MHTSVQTRKASCDLHVQAALWTFCALNLCCLNLSANTSLNLLPHSPSLSPLVFAKYRSKPPSLSMVRNALVLTLALTYCDSVSDHRRLFWIFGVHVLGVFWRDFGTL